LAAWAGAGGISRLGLRLIPYAVNDLGTAAAREGVSRVVTGGVEVPVQSHDPFGLDMGIVGDV